jgi:hypothetical protein
MYEFSRNNGESKEVIDSRPYVVSADIKILLSQWAEPRGFNIPSEKYFNDMRLDFSVFMRRIFPGFELVSEGELVGGINALVDKSGLYPISLDKVYYPTENRLDIARQVDKEGNDIGLGRRANSEYLLRQFREVKQLEVQEVSLVDDVIFSGDFIARVGKVLNQMGTKVKNVYAGIGIKEGIDLLQNQGYEVECVRVFDSVIDEICERDFYPGVPLSGRLVDSVNNVGAPYILPFGNPGKWATIPNEAQKSLSRFCIEQTTELFDAIEQVSGREVMCSDLDRKVLGIPSDSERFINVLSKIII